jgi:hypothetical protein
MSTLAQILARLDKLEARFAPPPPAEDHGPAIAARLALIRERMEAAGHKPRPGSPSGSRLSLLIEAARNASSRT